MTKTTGNSLQDRRIAVLISDGFEQSQLDEIVHDLSIAGATVEILAHCHEQLKRGIQGLQGIRPGGLAHAQLLVQDANPERYQGLFVPGGALSVDQMRESRLHVGFVQNILSAEKPVGLVGHAPLLLADSGWTGGRTLTSSPSIQKDLERAGAIWKDRDAIVDGNLVTARGPGSLAAFSTVFLGELAQLYQVNRQVA